MVPEGWHEATLDGICTKITKGTTPPKSEIVTDSDIPFLRVNNLTPGGAKGVSGELIYVSSAAHEKLLARSIAYPRDTLMNIVGPPLGKVTFLTDEYPEYNLNQAVLIYRPDEQQIIPEFLYMFICSFGAQQWLEARSKKTSGQQNLTIQLGKELPVALPPLPEQRKIADILSTWDQAIEKTEALLSNARTQKRALMQQLLTGKRRFPEFEGQPWKEVELGDVVSGIKGGGTPDKSNASFWEGEVPWVSVKDLKANVIYATIDTISEAGLKQSASNAFEAGTVVVSTRMAVGVTVKLGCRMAINQDLKAILPSKKLNNEFLYHFMKWSTDKLAALGTGSTVKGIKLLDLRRLPIWLPPSLEEQCRVVDVLEDADAEVESLTSDLSRLRIEKKALMQQLLTGKRRVVV